VANVILINKPK